MKILYRLLSVLLWLGAPAVLAQTPEKIYTRPLQEVLAEVETQYGVRLVYEDKNVNGRSVDYASWRFFADVEQTLDNILRPLELRYSKQSDGVYEIKKWEYFRKPFEEGRQHLDGLLASCPTPESWEARKALVRDNIIEVLGVAKIEKTSLNPQVTSLRRYDGYSVENVSLEVLPGVYLCGSLYKPLKYKGKIPAMLSPHGHFYNNVDKSIPNERGRYRPDQQYRCAMLARMGCAVFSYDMFAWGESALAFDPALHRTDLGIIMQTWNSIRALDYLTSLDFVDPVRIGVTGASGGGTQTLIIAAIDPRITLSVPTVMLSSHFFGGCPCESGLPIHFIPGQLPSNNAELGALVAPRPMLVISDGGDWTQTVPEIEMPYLKKIYALCGKPENVENVHLAKEGHDYGFSKRTAMYDFVSARFGLDASPLKDKSGSYDESRVTVESAMRMYAFGPERQLPKGAVISPEELRRLLAPARTAEGAMKYRMIPVGNSQWMDPREREGVHRQIDRIAADGYNVISIGTYTFMPVHLVDYAQSPYPEAVQYPAAQVASNLATLRENIRYAKQKGIAYVVTRSYSHYAPYNFWLAHQAELNPGGVFDSLLRVAHQNDMFLNALAGKAPNTVPQQQWTNPCYRDFFLWSTQRVLELVPELDGFLNAYAEAAWTYDTERVGRGGWRSWKECVDYAATDSCFVDYTNRLWAMLQRQRGDKCLFGLRDWYVSPEVMTRLAVPKDKLLIAVKYAGYDQPLINYPPWAKDLLDEGYGVLLDMHVYDAEYPHPVYWYSYDIINRIVENMLQGGFTGIVYQDYTIRGEDSADNPIRRLTQKSVAAALEGHPYGEQEALAFLEPYYGTKGSARLLGSLEAVAEAQETFIKLMPAWFWRGDGLSVGGLQPPQWWMLADNPEAPDRMGFVRQNVIPMKEYVTAYLEGSVAFATAGKEWASRSLLTPPQVIALMERKADEALSLALEARELAPAGAPYLQDIVASAFIHRYLVMRNAAFLRAALAFYKSGYVYDGKYELSTRPVDGVTEDFSSECIEELQRFVAADLMMRRLMLDFAPRRRVMRHPNTYDAQKKIAGILNKDLEIPSLDEAAFGRIATLITTQPAKMLATAHSSE